MAFHQSTQLGNKFHKGDIYLHGAIGMQDDPVLKLTTSSGAIVAAGGATPAANPKNLKILIDGTVYRLLAATDWT